MNQKKGSLLVVDDDKKNRELISNYLCKSGYSTTEADGGECALKLVEKQSFDLVLLDIMMSDMDGYDVLKKLRQHYRPTELPIIMVTAKRHSNDIVNALEIGANDFISKPIDLKVLKARAETQIKLKQTEQAYQNIRRDLEQLVAKRTSE
ncbi:MAG: response regulator, partial [Gammaproteobacteria bacterium]